MKLLNAGNVIRLPLDEIEVGDRLRKVSDAQVQNLLLMAEDTGITTPVHVRKVGTKYILIDGAHRLEATRRLGLPDIAALVVECRQDEARAMEASNNLGAARMTPLQTAVFAASWKRDFYEMHPDRKPGVFKGNQHTGKVVAELSSLTRSVADAFGITERQSRKILAAGEALSLADAYLLDRAPNPVSLKDLADLAKVSEEADRRRVVEMLVDGSAKSVSKAQARLAAENVAAPTVKDPVEAAFKALMAAWKRAPLAVKRKFVHEVDAELSALEGNAQ